MIHRRHLLNLLMLLSVLAVPPLLTASAWGAPTKLPQFVRGTDAGAQGLAIRPADIALTATSGAALVGINGPRAAIHWTKWNSTNAVGHATVIVNPCGCAAQPERPVARVTVILANAKLLGGHHVFSTVRLKDVHLIGKGHVSHGAINGVPLTMRLSYSSREYHIAV